MSITSPAVTMRRGILYIYGSLMIALVFGLASSSLTARLMSAADLGQYRFLISCVSLLTSALTFGLYASAGVLIAGRRRSSGRVTIIRGASTQAWLIGLANFVCVGVVLVTGQAQDGSDLWFLAAIAGSTMAWPLLLHELLRAEGNFIGIAVLNAAPTALFLLLLAGSWLMVLPVDPALCATLFFVSQGCVVIGLVSGYGVACRPHRRGYAYLWKQNRKVGLNVYWASFLAALTAQSGILILQSVKSSTEVAVLALAVTVTAPLSMLPSALGTAYFSRLPGASGFPKGIVRLAWAASCIMGVSFCLIAPLLVQVLYGERFSSVIMPAQICGIAAVLHGIGDVYNRYYLANGDTAFLFHTAGLVCGVALLLGLPAGQLFGVAGVAVAKLISSATYTLYLAYNYHFRRRRYGTPQILE